MNYLSLFSGIEAASVAWRPLGWQCVGVAEIDPFPCAVLAHHYPDAPNLGSVTDITDEQIAALGPIDVVVGGSPCQDLSVAGKRAGLAGERSGLFHDQLRIFHAARHLCGARFLVWENVPGAFSSYAGRDFAVVVGAMAGCCVDVPEDGWGTEGVALGEHGLVEWAVLDAQWFGVAQRRRRVFAVLDVGDWAGRPPILLEPDRLRGDSAPSREAGEGVARCLAAGSARGSGYRNDDDTADNLIPAPHDVISPALKARDSKGPSSDGDGDGAILVPMVARTLRGEGFDASEDGTGRGTPLVPVTVGALTCGSGGSAGHQYRQKGNEDALVPVAVDVWNQSIDGDVAATLNAESGAPNHSGPKVMVPVVAPCLTSNYGKQPDSSDTSAGPMLVPVPFDTTQITSAENRSNPQAGDPCHPLAAGAHAPAIAFMADDYKDGGYEECDTARPLTTSADRTRAAPVIAFSGKDYGADAGEVAPTLRGMGHDSSHANGGGQVAVAFVQGELDGRMDGGTQEGSSDLPAGSVRAVRRCQGRGSPQERGLAGPQPGEPAEAVPQLPHEGAPLGQAVPVVREAAQGAGLLRDALPEAEEARRPDGSWMADPDEVLTVGVPRHEPRARALQQTCTTDAQRDAREASVEQKRAREEAMGGRAFQVRRLTPTECCRLQGFPDDYLPQVPWRGKTPPPDGPMYKALGNSMAVPVMRWIGQQIAAAASSRIAA